MSAVVGTWGWRARIKHRPGQSVAYVVARVPATESAVGHDPAPYAPSKTWHTRAAARCEFSPSTHMQALSRGPGPTAKTLASPHRDVRLEDATTVRVPLLRRHALIGGTIRFTQERCFNVVLGKLVACPDVVLWGIGLT